MKHPTLLRGQHLLLPILYHLNICYLREELESIKKREVISEKCSATNFFTRASSRDEQQLVLFRLETLVRSESVWTSL